MILEVDKTKELKLGSDKKILCQCDDCGVRFSRKYRRVCRKVTHRCSSCSHKFWGQVVGKLTTNKTVACGPNHYRWNPDKTKFEEYKRQVRRLSEQVYRTYKDVINPSNLKRAVAGICDGYQLDHIISIKEGFEKKIPVCEISHINNLQMLPWQENLAKSE